MENVKRLSKIHSVCLKAILIRTVCLTAILIRTVCLTAILIRTVCFTAILIRTVCLTVVFIEYKKKLVDIRTGEPAWPSGKALGW